MILRSKYTEGGSEHVCPANIETSLEKSLKEYAINAHKALGCRHYSRVDFIVTDPDGNIYARG